MLYSSNLRLWDAKICMSVVSKTVMVEFVDEKHFINFFGINNAWNGKCRNQNSVTKCNWQYMSSLGHSISKHYKATHCMQVRYMLWPFCLSVYPYSYIASKRFKMSLSSLIFRSPSFYFFIPKKHHTDVILINRIKQVNYEKFETFCQRKRYKTIQYTHYYGKLVEVL